VQICDAGHAGPRRAWGMLWKPIGRDEVSTAMSEFRPSNDVPLVDAAARCNGLRERMLVGLILFTLVRSTEALAGDQASLADGTLDTGAGGIRQSPKPPLALTLPLDSFTAPTITEEPRFSATDFRPRKPTVFDKDPAASAFGETSLLRNTTVWQRLSEYRSHDRVRVLTLWESGSSSVSLQAGRRGDPSLQWTSRLMNRGGATQGVLDRWFSTSLARAGMGLRSMSRSMSAAPPKPAAAPVEAAGAK
jgi:hypothetical protein